MKKCSGDNNQKYKFVANARKELHDENNKKVINTAKNHYKRMKYNVNIVHRQEQISAMNKRYENSVCSEKKKSAMKMKYQDSSVCRERKKNASRKEYERNKEKVKDSRRKTYSLNDCHRREKIAATDFDITAIQFTE